MTMKRRSGSMKKGLHNDEINRWTWEIFLEERTFCWNEKEKACAEEFPTVLE